MNSEYEEERAYIQKEIRGGLNLKRDFEQVKILLSSMGLPAKTEQMVVAGAALDPRRIAWARNPVKNIVERTLALGALGIMGPGSLNLARKMVKVHHANPFYKLEVGFWGSGRKTNLLKVRTMNIGADRQIAPLNSTRLMGGRPIVKPDSRILNPVAEDGRKSSLDEGPQLLQVAINPLMGLLDLVGLRGWVVKSELRDLDFLYRHIDDSELNPLRPLLNIYQEKIRQFDPMPAIISPLSASLSKNSNVYNCLLGDLLWVYNCDWNVWTHLVVNTYRNRILKSMGSR